jgi:hypothetical protein
MLIAGHDPQRLHYPNFNSFIMGNNHSIRSSRLCCLRVFQLSTEDSVPEAACNTKTVLKVGEMVLEVVLLEPTVV